LVTILLLGLRGLLLSFCFTEEKEKRKRKRKRKSIGISSFL